MSAREKESDDMKSDDAIREELYDSVVALLEQRQRDDASVDVFDRKPLAFTLKVKNGHFLTFQQGPGKLIAQGMMQWKPGEDEDAPFEFSVRRSTVDPSKLQLNSGPEMNVDGIANDIVGTFFSHVD